MEKQHIDDEDAIAYSSGGFEMWDSEPELPIKGFLIAAVMVGAAIAFWLL